jgi:hypothetical protein
VKLVWFDLFKFGILKLEIVGFSIAAVAIDFTALLGGVIFIGEAAGGAAGCEGACMSRCSNSFAHIMCCVRETATEQ